jgi:hypothetical protein
MKEKYYKIKYDDYEFFATVLKEEDIEDSIKGRSRIKFGGKRGCIDIVIFPDHYTGELCGLKYHNECAINKDLEKGIGTVVMLKSALKFVYTLFPKIKIFDFKDISQIKCKRGIHIPLSSYYIGKYSKTWYMYKFNAKLKDKIKQTKIDNGNNILDTQFTNYNEFYNRYILPFKYKIPQLYINEIKRIFELSTTYRQFITELDKDYDCIIFDNWLHRFITDIFDDLGFQEETWIIKKKEVMKWNDVIVTKTKDNSFKKINKPFIIDIKGGFFPFGKTPTNLYKSI